MKWLTMRYRSFNSHQINPTSKRRKNNLPVLSKSRLITTVKVVSALVVIFWGVKLLLSPVMDAFASMIKDSTATISYLITRPSVKKDDDVTNFLVLGVDERFTGGTSLTDTIIIVSFRYTDKHVTMLSIPRDLWVKIPAFDGIESYYSKINSVYSVGEQNGYTDSSYNDLGGGSALLARMISDQFGIPIHYTGKINFDGFRNAIDLVGGIDVYVEEAFTDYEYPREGYEDAPWESRWEIVSFAQGWQHMDGETALKYARSRHAFGPEGSDFARARRQQKVLVALKDKVLSNETLFDLTKVKNLYLSLTSKLSTDVTLTEVPLLYEIAKQQSESEIENMVLTNGDETQGLLYSPDPNEFGGAFVLLPRDGWDTLRSALKAKLYPSKNE